MSEAEVQRHRKAITAWRRADAALQALRRAEIRASDPAAIRQVVPTAEMMRRLGIEVSAETGLIEQQRWFVRLRHV
jgi:hypothetical protein